jgi:acetyl esterase/lipase
MYITRCTMAVLALLLGCVRMAEAAQSARTIRDVEYARVDGKPLVLDLHLPAGVLNPALVVYVHGGVWSEGSKAEYPAFLVERGYALASLDFRSTHEARFPANVHDIKAGIRFLRAKAAQYGYHADRIAIAGSSSGGHLAALVGVTSGVAELEGREGEHLRESSAVQAIVSFYGASNLSTILAQSTPDGLKVRVPGLQKLLGGQPEQVPALAKLASPVSHVDGKDPPALLLHGDQDAQMPVNQTLELQAAYRNAGLVAEMHILHGAGHGAPGFYTGETADTVVKFLKRTLAR